MQGKFRFGLDGADATARQIGELRRQIRELSPNVVKSAARVNEWIANAFKSSPGSVSLSGDDPDSGSEERIGGVLAPSYGGTGTDDAYMHPITTGPCRAAWVAEDGEVGVLPSALSVVDNVVDADEFIDVQGLRQVKWRVFMMQDDLNLHLGDATPMVGDRKSVV